MYTINLSKKQKALYNKASIDKTFKKEVEDSVGECPEFFGEAASNSARIIVVATYEGWYLGRFGVESYKNEFD